MTELVEVKTQDLLGAALDWATFCAVYTGMQPTIHVIESTTKVLFAGAKPVTFPRAVSLSYSGAYGVDCGWNPSVDWDCGGPLILSRGVSLRCIAPLNAWDADCWDDSAVPSRYCESEAETPLIAACRAIVFSVLGDTVKVPKEILS